MCRAWLCARVRSYDKGGSFMGAYKGGDISGKQLREQCEHWADTGVIEPSTVPCLASPPRRLVLVLAPAARRRA